MIKKNFNDIKRFKFKWTSTIKIMHSLKESEKYLLTLTFRFFPARSRTEKNFDRKKKNKISSNWVPALAGKIYMRFLWQILVDLPPGRDETFCRANSNNPAFDDVQRTLRVIVYSLLSLFLCSSMFEAFTILSSVPFFLFFFSL